MLANKSKVHGVITTPVNTRQPLSEEHQTHGCGAHTPFERGSVHEARLRTRVLLEFVRNSDGSDLNDVIRWRIFVVQITRFGTVFCRSVILTAAQNVTLKNMIARECCCKNMSKYSSWHVKQGIQSNAEPPLSAPLPRSLILKIKQKSL